MTIAFAGVSDPSVPLHVVGKTGLPDWLAAQPEPVRQWLGATAFDAALGDVRSVPDAAGNVMAAVIGTGDAAAEARI